MTTEVAQARELKPEQARTLADGAANALALFDDLEGLDWSLLPGPAAAAISALRTACEKARVEPLRAQEPVGSIIIEWAPRFRDGYALPGWGTSIFDAVSGEAITTASEARIVHLDASSAITADLTLFTDLEGSPVLNGNTLYPDENGKVRTGVFRYYVAEMRVRP